ncbi:MAG: hypothetical protein AABM33_08005 [Pseudomonadota bacterium]
MSHLGFLPTLILPNIANAQDSTAVYADGARASAAEALRRIGTAEELRLMVASTDHRSAANPRVTWQHTPDDYVVVSAAFVSAEDQHGRFASAAVIFELDRIDEMERSIPAGLPKDQHDSLLQFFQANKDSVISEIREQRAAGIAGGQVGLLKKKERIAFRSRY